MQNFRDRLRHLTGPVDAAERRIVEVVERATSEMMINPDWGVNMELVDILNTEPSNACFERVFKALRRRLVRANPKIQILTLTLLETCVKNTGSEFQAALPGSDFWEEVVRLADPKRKADLQVQDKVLVLVEDCAHALTAPRYKSVYDTLKQTGVRFPVRAREEIGAGFNLPPSSRDVNAIHVAGAVGGGGVMAGVSEEDQRAIQEAMRDLSTPPAAAQQPPPPPPPTYRPIVTDEENKEKLKADLRVVANSLDLLKDALGSIPLNEPELVYQDYIKDLSQQCTETAPRLQRLIGTATDETLLAEALRLNDELGTVLERHLEMVKKAENAKKPVVADEPALLSLDDVVSGQAQANGASSSHMAQPPMDDFAALAAVTSSQPPPPVPPAVQSTTPADPFDLLAAQGTHAAPPTQQQQSPQPTSHTQQTNAPKEDKDPFEDLISL